MTTEEVSVVASKFEESLETSSKLAVSDELGVTE